MKYLLNIETEERISIWRNFKALCALKGKNMIDVIFELIEQFTAKNK